MKFDIVADSRKKLLIAAHRGAAGGNIPCNTISAYEAALYQGADMIEIDIARSADGYLYVFHPGMEPAHLCSEKYIRDMDSSEVNRMFLVNQDRTPTQFHVSLLDEVLDRFKDRCYINIDKFWMWPEEIANRVRAHGMEDQILIKTSADMSAIEKVEELAPDLPYMIIAKESDEFSMSMNGRNLRYVGVEALFTTNDAPICSMEYINNMHANGYIVWANAIIYDHRAVLAAGHSDDVSAPGNPDAGWGWLARRGFDIIQTDWVMPCIHYLQGIGKR